jgi:hypothetical protein
MPDTIEQIEDEIELAQSTHAAMDKSLQPLENCV